MKRICLAVLLSTACAGLAHASAGLIDTLQSTGKFNIYIQLHNAAGMEAFPPTQAHRTFLVPTDAAFAKLPAGTLEALANDPQQLRAFLHAHAIDGIVDVGAMIGPTPASKARLMSIGGSGIEVGGNVQGGQPVVRLKMLQAEGIVGERGMLATMGGQAMNAAAGGQGMGDMGSMIGTQAMNAVVGEKGMEGMGGMVAQQAMAAVVGTPATAPVATTKQSTTALLAQQGFATLFGRKKVDKKGLASMLANQAIAGAVGEKASQEVIGEEGMQEIIGEEGKNTRTATEGLQAMLTGAALNQVQAPEGMQLAGVTGLAGLAPLRTLSLGARIGDPYNVLVAEGVMHGIDAVLTVDGTIPR